MRKEKNTSNTIVSLFLRDSVSFMDIFSPQMRSLNMRLIHSRDTTPEIKVRSFLFRQGFRFRLHVKKLPGHPDIVLPKYRTVIEVRGCFWHRHAGCKRATTPSTNVEFWREKFERNVDRDEKTEKQLKELGWNLIVVWECELKPAKREETLDSIAFTLNHIWLQDHGRCMTDDVRGKMYPQMDEENMQMPMAAEGEV